MRLIGSSNLHFGHQGASPRRDADTAVSDSRALVAVAPAVHSQSTPPAHRDAPFLAQLIATRDQHPQMRERRRADPDTAIAAYRAAMALTKPH